jgi:multidrug resistance efflux pump
MGIPSLFRERASPETQVRESLDEQVPVIRGPTWLGFVLAVLVIIAVAVWALSSHVQDTVKATGAVMSSPAPFDVQAPITGTVIQAPPAVSTHVQAGAVLARLRTSAHTTTAVLAPASGTILNRSTTPGSVVQPGQTLMQLEPQDSVHRAYLYVSLSDATDVKTGQQVLVSAAGPAQQQETLIKGQVIEVQHTPATPARLDQVLGPTLGPRTATGPPVIEVIADLGATGSQAGTGLALQTPLQARVVISKSSLFHLTF